MKKLLLPFLLTLALGSTLTACSSAPQTLEDTSNSRTTTSTQVQSTNYTPTTVTDDIIKQNPNYVIVHGKADITDDITQDATYSTFTTDELTNGAIHYDGLDSLGRTLTISGVITYKMREEGSLREREDMPDPSGWKTNGKSNNSKVTIDLLDGTTYKGYFYNRSHLIAKSLGGVETQENLITGTRTQNVGKNNGNGGMAYTEKKARNYLDTHIDQVVYYKATPVYIGSELVPRSVFVDIKTQDGTLDEHVEVLNATYGFTIDYESGQFKEN